MKEGWMKDGSSIKDGRRKKDRRGRRIEYRWKEVWLRIEKDVKKEKEGWKNGSGRKDGRYIEEGWKKDGKWMGRRKKKPERMKRMEEDGWEEGKRRMEKG